MLSSLSWQIFLTTIALLVTGYYTVTSLLLYRTEITAWVRSRFMPPTESRPVQKVKSERKKTHSIMGSINGQDILSEPRSSVVSADDFSFAGEEELADPIELPAAVPAKDDLLIGTVADLLQEIKTVTALITECNSDKAECESLLRTLLVRYPHLKQSSFCDAISIYICTTAKDNFLFDLSLPEVMLLWNESTSKKIITHP